MNRFSLIFVGLVVIGLASFVYLHSRTTSSMVACTMEAKLCPDGSYVGRHGPTCEFDTCPQATTTPPVRAGKVETGVEGIVTLGPTCPVERIPPDPQCADRPYPTTLVLASTVVGKNGGVLIQTDAKGYFSEELSPGTYTIRAQSSAMLPRLSPVTFTVVEHQLTSLNLQFDTGIR